MSFYPMPDVRPAIVITSGEPAGIGPDIITCIKESDFDARLIVVGDFELLEARARTLNSKLKFSAYSPENTFSIQNQIEVIHIPLNVPSKIGTLDSNNAEYVLNTLKRACSGCLSGEFDAMVTAPVQKEIINRAGIKFSGHTEFLAELCAAEKPVMLLAAGDLRVALVTTHLPLRQVPDAINQELIICITRILDRDLRSRFGIQKPHIKICGLNPHAGENGYLGHEEIDVIIPAIQSLKDEGVNISGPYPADTVFTPDALSNADVILAMYHDQGLPVLKHAGFHRAINTTLGLPIIRTSVDHGTALDLAGSGRAHAGSLFEAIHSAISQSQFRSKEASTA